VPRFEINDLFQSRAIAIEQHSSGSTAPCFRSIAVIKLLTVSAIVMLAT
jgi:hypothetical protein